MWLDGSEFRFSANTEGANDVQRDGTQNALVAA